MTGMRECLITVAWLNKLYLRIFKSLLLGSRNIVFVIVNSTSSRSKCFEFSLPVAHGCVLCNQEVSQKTFANHGRNGTRAKKCASRVVECEGCIKVRAAPINRCLWLLSHCIGLVFTVHKVYMAIIKLDTVTKTSVSSALYSRWSDYIIQWRCAFIAISM